MPLCIGGSFILGEENLKLTKILARTPVLIAMVVLYLVGLTAPSLAQDQQDLFNLSANGGIIDREPWPVVPHTGMRLWDTGTSWREINISEGVYDWSSLDLWLAATKANHNDVLYTFGLVPQWASSKPNDGSCSPSPGACDPPKDVNPDGSGSDQLWKDFVTALVQHSQNSATGHIEFWEMWNEPMNPIFWNGTYAQLLRMISDAYAIIKGADPQAVIVSPAFAWESKAALNWMGNYFAAGGAQYAEIIAVHGYVFDPYGKYGPPENLISYYSEFRAVLRQYGQASKPIWDTEANWGSKDHFTNADLQAAWIARFYTLHAFNHIQRLYWFLYNGGLIGGLWERNAIDPRKPGTLLKPGIAYEQVGHWLLGATTGVCSSDHTIWTCGLTRAGGYQGQIVWDTAESCSQGKCKTTDYTVGSEFVNYRNLEGQKVSIGNGVVPIGAKPILLENQ